MTAGAGACAGMLGKWPRERESSSQVLEAAARYSRLFIEPSRLPLSAAKRA